MQDVVWTLDLRRRQFTWISPSVEKLRGYTAEEVMRMRLEDSFTGESAEKVNKLLDKVGVTLGKAMMIFLFQSENWSKPAATDLLYG
jgi:PAS domain-containing protein